MFNVHLLPAGHGDCLWIEYGDPAKPHRVLVDGGERSSYKECLEPKLALLPEDQLDFELFVLTHIDGDHIAGSLELFKDPARKVRFKDVWFNDYRHLPEGLLGERQAMDFAAALETPTQKWNDRFGGNAVAIEEDATQLPMVELEGGLKLTILGPTMEKLARLRRRWTRYLERSGLLGVVDPGLLSAESGGDPSDSMDVDALADSQFKKDRSEPNGSSIAFLAEFEGKRILLSGDAHVETVIQALVHMRQRENVERVKLDALKVSHHGSAKNLSNGVLELVDCENYLISTNGHRFGHPDRKAIARIIKYGGEKPNLMFNFRSPQTEIWDDAALKEQHGYETEYPAAEGEGIVWAG